MTRRSDRLAGEIRDEVARMVASDLKDPRLGFITVTRVELTQDLRYARVYVGVLGEDATGESLAILRKAAGFVKREIGRRLRVRFAPEIDFRYDRGLEATERVARVLAEEEAQGRGPAKDTLPNGTRVLGQGSRPQAGSGPAKDTLPNGTRVLGQGSRPQAGSGPREDEEPEEPED